MIHTRRTLIAFAIALAGLLPTGAQAGNPTVITEIARHAEANDVFVGVSALHLPSGRRIRVNADERFPLASTYKVPMAAFALHLVSEGQLSLDQMIAVEPEDLVVSSSITRLFPHPGIQLSLLNLMEATLIQSDNTATDVLLRTIGGGPAVTAWLERSDIRDMRVDRSTANLIRDYMEIPRTDASMAVQYEALDFDHLSEADWIRLYEALIADPRDQGTPDAMVTLLAGLWQDAYLEAAHGETLRGIMGRCLTGSRRLSGRMPEQQLPIAHKTGTLGGTVNDVGVMTLPDGRGEVVLAVYTRGASALDVAAGERAISEIGRTVYDYFLFSGN